MAAKKQLAAIILAAGDGTRMLSQIPKVIHPLYGKPLVRHVLDAVRGAGISKIIVVLGYRSDLVKQHLGNGVETVVQKGLKGTGHAVKQAMPKLKGFKGDIVVLYGDTPLITSETVKGLVAAHRKAKAYGSLLTAHLKEPTGYGRIVRDQTGEIVRIVEEQDATQAERSIEEINVGTYAFDADFLGKALSRVKPAPNGEYYLTDTIADIVKHGGSLGSATTRSVGEFLGINTRADLARVQTIMRSRLLEQFMLGGVTIVDPYTTYIDKSAQIGQDTVVYPHTVIEEGAKVGKGCKIGPFSRLGKGTQLADRVSVANFVELEDCHLASGVRVLSHSCLFHARVSANALIGAGTMTTFGVASGRQAPRQKIQIGKDALVHGGTVFLGPVKIQAGEQIQAGSQLGKVS